MIATLLLALAVAAPPDGVDLDDLDRWHEAARAFDAGPDGCWELEGELVLRLLHDGGASRFAARSERDVSTRGTVRARFEDHAWTRFHYTLDREHEPWMVVRPFWGEVEKGAIRAVDEDGDPLVSDEERARNAERRERTRRRFGGMFGDGDEEGVQMTSILSASWDDEAGEVRFEESATLAGLARGDAVVVHRFPGGGPVATAFDLTLPKGMAFGRWPLQGRILEGSIHVRSHPADGVVIPHAQRFSALVALFGQTFGADSQVVFTRAWPCVPTEPTEEPPPEG